MSQTAVSRSTVGTMIDSHLTCRLSLLRAYHWLDFLPFTQNYWRLKLVKVLNPNSVASHEADYFYIVGVTFEQIAKSIDKDEVWVAAGLYGQVHQHS